MYVIIETCDREQNALFSEDIAVARQMLYDLAVENELYEVDHDEIMQGLVTGVKEGDYRAELLEARPIQPKSLPGAVIDNEVCGGCGAALDPALGEKHAKDCPNNPSLGEIKKYVGMLADADTDGMDDDEVRVTVQLTAKQRDLLIEMIDKQMVRLSESMAKSREMGATLHLPIVQNQVETLAAARERLKAAC